MFACVYCVKDNSLTVIGQKSKQLELLGEWKARESVNLTWKKNVFSGTIVKTGENEEDLTNFATKADSRILKKLKTKPVEVPEELFKFQHKAVSTGKRPSRKTDRLKESEQQSEEFSPAKKKKTLDGVTEKQVSKSMKSQSDKNEKLQVSSKAQAGKIKTPTNEKNEKKKVERKVSLRISNDLLSDFSSQFSPAPSPIKSASNTPKKSKLNTPKNSKLNTPKNTRRHSTPNKSEQSPRNTKKLSTPKTPKLSTPKTPKLSTPKTPKLSTPNTRKKSASDTPKKSTIKTPKKSIAVPSTTYQTVQIPALVQDTSLTSTWALVKTNTQVSDMVYQELPDPPQDVLNLFELIQKPFVQTYMRKLVEYFKNKEHLEHEATYYENSINLPESDSGNTEYSAGNYLQELQEQPSEVDNTQQFCMMQHMPEAQPFIQLPDQQPLQSHLQQPTFIQQPQSVQNQSQPIHQQNDALVSLNPSKATKTKRCIPFAAGSQSQLDDMNDLQTPRKSPKNATQQLRQNKELGSLTPDQHGRVKLLKSSDVTVNSKQLKRATKLASRVATDKAAFTLASKLVTLLFTTQELALSCGQGLRLREDDMRPPLDAAKIEVIKDYVSAWCLLHQKGTAKDCDLNDSITEQVSYARRKVKNNIIKKN